MEADLGASPPLDSVGAAAHSWLRQQSSIDWSAADLPSFTEWDPGLLSLVQTLAQSSSPMALMLGRAGVLVANDSALRLIAEASPTPVNGKAVQEVFPGIAALCGSILDRARSGKGTSLRAQPLRMIRDGRETTRWFDLELTPVFVGVRELLAVLCVAADVTAYVQRIQRSAESEARLRLALEGSGMVGVWTHEVATNRSFADASVAHTYGLAARDCEAGVDDALFLDAVHPSDRHRVVAALSHAVRTGTSYRCRYRIVAHDDRLRWVVASAKPRLDANGRVDRLLGVVVDITEQVENDSALAESRFRFQTLTETLPQIVWSSDAEGRHDYFSARWSEFTGVAPDRITEDTWKKLVFPAHRPMVMRAWDEARRTGQPYDIDYRFRHHSGEYRWLRVMALPIRDEEGRITRWFGTSTDVNDSYLVAAEREHLAQELERIATEDELTRAFTRRAFIERGTSLVGTAKAPMSLLMLDIDHFKSINDAHGHPGGDKVLAIVAKRIKAVLKKQDLVGRMGGEEFAVALPHCAQAQALRVAERIREAVEATPVKLDENQQVTVTVSIGVTTKEVEEHRLDDLLMVADRALYAAKNGGRNRAVLARMGAV